MSQSDIVSLYDTFAALKEKLESGVQQAIADSEGSGFDPSTYIDKTVVLELLNGYNNASADFESIKADINYTLPIRKMDTGGLLTKEKVYALMQTCILRIDKILGALSVAKEAF